MREFSRGRQEPNGETNHPSIHPSLLPAPDTRPTPALSSNIASHHSRVLPGTHELALLFTFVIRVRPFIPPRSLPLRSIFQLSSTWDRCRVPPVPRSIGQRLLESKDDADVARTWYQAQRSLVNRSVPIRKSGGGRSSGSKECISKTWLT